MEMIFYHILMAVVLWNSAFTQSIMSRSSWHLFVNITQLRYMILSISRLCV